MPRGGHGLDLLWEDLQHVVGRDEKESDTSVTETAGVRNTLPGKGLLVTASTTYALGYRLGSTTSHIEKLCVDRKANATWAESRERTRRSMHPSLLDVRNDAGPLGRNSPRKY